MEAGPAGLTDVDKRTSLPVGSVGMSPESPSDPREELIGVLPALRPSPEAIGDSSEANGPCSGHSPLPEQLSPGAATVTKAKGDDVVEVVWAGLRVTENSATGPTDVELEAKVEEVVLEAIGARQHTSSPELPTWVKEGRGVVEVVWEGLGGSDPDITGQSGRGPEATHTRSPKLQGQSEVETSRKEEDAIRDSPEGVGQGGPGGEEGSFIWVERVALSEDWEELLMEGLEAPPGVGCEGGPVTLMGAQSREGEASWEVERREMEKSEDIETRGKVETLREERDGAAKLLDATQAREENQAEKEERKDSEILLPAEIPTDEEKWEVKTKEDKEPLEVEKGGEEESATTEEILVAEKNPEGSPEPERKGNEKPLDQERDGESSLDREPKTTEILLTGETGGEGSLDEETKGSKLLDEGTGGESSLDEETKGSKLLDEGTGGEGSLDEETKGSKLSDREAGATEPSPEVEKTSGAKEEVSPEEQGKSNEGAELPVEDASQPGAALPVQEELTSEEQGLQGPEKQEGPVEEAATKSQPSAESEEPPGDDAAPLLAETPAPEQPAEGQPLLHQEVAGTTPGDHPAPTYAPARRLELTEAKEDGGPKQKTCQCCVVM